MSGPHVLVVDDEADIRSLIKDILGDEGFEVTSAADAAEARAAREKKAFDLVLLDIWMPDTDGISLLREWSSNGGLGCPVVIMSGHGTVDTAVEATRLGAFDFVEKPLSLAKLLRTVERALEAGKKKDGDARKLLAEVAIPVGRSRVMQQVREQVRRFAGYDSPVLFVGETGTGRGAFARFLHSMSAVASGEFVKLMAASLTDSNAETQLFGSEQGGTIQEGALDKARGGTLYIDELTDLCPQAQRLLLSALEQGFYVRAGGKDEIKVNARVLASIAPDYEAKIAAGTLRRDLVASLNVLSLQVPPLREYAEDVPELLSYYVDKLVESEGLAFRHFGVAAQNRLRNHPWPENVRGLKNFVRARLMTEGPEEISLEEVERDLGARIAADEPLVKQDLLSLPLREAREQFERAYLQQQLGLCDGKVGKLAKRVGMERTHLYRKLRLLGIDFKAVGKDD
jgi:DNA-binding NtrC family response regulator